MNEYTVIQDLRKQVDRLQKTLIKESTQHAECEERYERLRAALVTVDKLGDTWRFPRAVREVVWAALAADAQENKQ